MLVPYMNHDPWLLKDYYRPCTKRDGSRGWSGGRDLQSSADFTKVFCNKLLHCWLDAQGVQWMLGLDSVRIPNVSTLKCVMEGLDWAWWLTCLVLFSNYRSVAQRKMLGPVGTGTEGLHLKYLSAFLKDLKTAVIHRCQGGTSAEKQENFGCMDWVLLPLFVGKHFLCICLHKSAVLATDEVVLKQRHVSHAPVLSPPMHQGHVKEHWTIRAFCLTWNAPASGV